MEVEAVKQQLQKAWKDREEFRSHVCAYKFLLETVQTSLSEEVCKTQVLEKHAANQCRSSSASPYKPQLGNVPEVGPEVFDMESLAE
jgi:hypothetical protein